MLIRWSQWGKPSAVKKGNFLLSTVKNAAGLIKTVKKFQGISNLTISDDLQGLLAAAESPTWKNQFACSQKLSLQTLQDLRACFYGKLERPR